MTLKERDGTSGSTFNFRQNRYSATCSLHSMGYRSLPLKKRPWIYFDEGQLSMSKSSGHMWDPDTQVKFLRSLPETHEDAPLALVVHDESPWKIKKNLYKSDIGDQARLLLPKESMRSHVIPLMSDEMVTKIGSKDGMVVTVMDRDTATEDTLVLKYWWKLASFVFNGKWVEKFVTRRGLMIGDEIGLYWDQHNQRFVFSVLKRRD